MDLVGHLYVWDGATLALENVKTWEWVYNTVIHSVASGNADTDGQVEIVTGRSYYQAPRTIAQLCIWNGAS